MADEPQPVDATPAPEPLAAPAEAAWPQAWAAPATPAPLTEAPGRDVDAPSAFADSVAALDAAPAVDMAADTEPAAVEYETLTPWMIVAANQETRHFKPGDRFVAADVPTADLAGLGLGGAIRAVPPEIDAPDAVAASEAPVPVEGVSGDGV